MGYTGAENLAHGWGQQAPAVQTQLQEGAQHLLVTQAFCPRGCLICPDTHLQQMAIESGGIHPPHLPAWCQSTFFSFRQTCKPLGKKDEATFRGVCKVPGSEDVLPEVL